MSRTIAITLVLISAPSLGLAETDKDTCLKAVDNFAAPTADDALSNIAEARAWLNIDVDGEALKASEEVQRDLLVAHDEAAKALLSAMDDVRAICATLD